MIFNKVSIIGVGLIGASLSLAIRKKGLAKLVYGYGRHEENLKRAVQQGIIDSYSMTLKDVCKEADLVVLSTPVGVFLDIVKAIRAFLKKGSILIDVGSVKGRLVYDLEAMMPEGVHYLGTHPIAGSDKSGIDDAKADLFDGALCIITPTERSSAVGMETVAGMWKEIGARIEIMDPYRHDEIYGAVSHLPHIVAYTLVNTIGDIDSGYIDYAGQGFRDATRIAMSSPELWKDIVIFNKDNLIKFLSLFKKNLERIEALLKDPERYIEIEKEFLRAMELRKRLES